MTVSAQAKTELRLPTISNSFMVNDIEVSFTDEELEEVVSEVESNNVRTNLAFFLSQLGILRKSYLWV